MRFFIFYRLFYIRLKILLYECSIENDAPYKTFCRSLEIFEGIQIVTTQWTRDSHHVVSIIE